MILNGTFYNVTNDNKKIQEQLTTALGLANCVRQYRVSMLIMTTWPHSSTSTNKLHSFR